MLRRLLRRAARHGRILGIEGSFLVALSNRVIEVSGEAYPELLEKKEYIQKIIQVEEDNFATTIDKGEEIIAGYIDDLKQTGKTVLDGASVFKLYDTFGFPLELTEEILAENGFTADKEGFQTHMQAQKELARKNRKSNEDEGWDKNELDLDIPKTVFTGYDTLLDTGKILAILADGKLTGSVSEGQKAVVLVDQTPFYAEGGGQVCDKGFMSTVTEADDEKIFDAEVIKVEKKDGIFYHTVMVLANSIHVGDEVLLTVDPEKRNAAARNHTATHLLQKALKEVVGNHVEQAGSMVNESMLRFDFSHFEAVTSEQLAKVEAIVNEMIDNFLPVTTAEMSLEEAQKTGAMALFGEKYGSTVRVVNAGDWSIELCGGTHVKNTGEIGAFKIISEGGVASGVRRIEAVTGAGVLQAAKQAENILGQVCEALKCNKTVLADKAKSMAEELKALKKELEEMKKAAMGGEADAMVAGAKQINGVKLICKEFADYQIADLRNLSDDIKAANKGIVMVFATVNGPKVTFLVSVTDDLLDKGYHAGNMIKQIAAACGGGGGGKADMAQAGAKDPSKIKDAFALAESLIK